MIYKIGKYSGVVGIVYIDTIPKKFAIVQTSRGFSLPGGGIEKSDDSIELAMYREIKEELGLCPECIEIQKTNEEEFFEYDKNKTGRENEKVIRPIFLVKSKTDKLCPEATEIISAKWYSYEDAIKILTWENSKDTIDKFKKILD